MRILFCVNSLGAMGGIQRVTIVKANALAEIQGNEVAICYTDKGNYPKTIHPLSPKVAIFDLGTPYWQFTSMKKILLSFLPTVLATRKALKNLIRQYKPNIVITTGTYEKFALASLSLSRRLLVGCCAWGGNVLYIREFHFSSTYRRLLGESLCSRVYAYIGELLDNKLLARCFTKNYVLTQQDLNENFRNNSRFDYMYNPCSFQSKGYVGNRTNTVLAVGRLVTQKNFEELLEIWSLIIDKNRDWLLRIVGNGNLEQNLKKTAADLGISDSVDFIGFSDRIEEEMNKASIYVMTSLYEGFGLVLVEAQCSGLPCVSYDLPYGPADIIHDTVDGFIVENRNKRLFAEKLDMLMNNEKMRQEMGARAKQNAKRFSIETIIEQWMEKYDTLLRYK